MFNVHCFFIPDTESAKASRRQLKDAMYSVLFDMNVPSVCAIDQVCPPFNCLYIMALLAFPILEIIFITYILFLILVALTFKYEAHPRK